MDEEQCDWPGLKVSWVLQPSLDNLTIGGGGMASIESIRCCGRAWVQGDVGGPLLHITLLDSPKVLNPAQPEEHPTLGLKPTLRFPMQGVGRGASGLFAASPCKRSRAFELI